MTSWPASATGARAPTPASRTGPVGAAGASDSSRVSVSAPEALRAAERLRTAALRLLVNRREFQPRLMHDSPATVAHHSFTLCTTLYWVADAANAFWVGARDRPRPPVVRSRIDQRLRENRDRRPLCEQSRRHAAAASLAWALHGIRAAPAERPQHPGFDEPGEHCREPQRPA